MKRLKEFFAVYLTQLTKLVKTSQNWLPHARTILKLSAKVLRCPVELHYGNVFWRKNFDPHSSPGLLTSHFPRENPGDEVDFHPVRSANSKWPIKEATTLNRSSNKRYLKLTSMGSSIIKKVIYLPPFSAASWQRNWLASVSAQLKEMVWMGTGFNSCTWASMDDGGWKGNVKGVKIHIVCCNRDLIWSDNSDVRENVAEKYMSHPFKPFRDYPKSPCYLKEGNLGWSWREGTAPEFRHRWLNLSPCSSPKELLGILPCYVKVVHGRQNEITEKLEAHAELAPLAFC